MVLYVTFVPATTFAWPILYAIQLGEMSFLAVISFKYPFSVELMQELEKHKCVELTTDWTVLSRVISLETKQFVPIQTFVELIREGKVLRFVASVELRQFPERQIDAVVISFGRVFKFVRSVEVTQFEPIQTLVELILVGSDLTLLMST